MSDLAVSEATEGIGAESPRPQALLLAFFGGHVLGRGIHVATASVLDVLDRAGVSEHATRSTLSRMARRGLLHRVRRGRHVYIGLTERSRAILHDGERRIWRDGVVNRQWDGTWTLLGFSMPESWQRQRHALRSRLLWAGFGSLQSGLWIAPGEVDVPPLLDGLDADGHVKVFQGRALPPTEVAAIIQEAWDVDRLAGRYRAFLSRWQDPLAQAPDSLARDLLLESDWLQTIRHDPRLPREHLPAGWPAEPAQELFFGLSAEAKPAARATATEVLDTITDEQADEL
ncbi:PaaX family transcriptional regulator C-terminal domain-containing protein [Amycolatopsis mongoliensis]|uniref:PaaX family transcriptional regulator C-terminal domain-containing protein n=1 Tax=Amycolatopsis mongoliensis TaxID=715475 RepID=A0A9Y2JJZ1_9PSEU|nr:PaaX family transcriptional regulator C-terminal domain-containing protein [Amycolatopsis sp. 4-36]WIX98865.1 PaaX family transcriptional regulator C-terminal domain-containing protein [Amycolatopsis sp. 4-36]